MDVRMAVVMVAAMVCYLDVQMAAVWVLDWDILLAEQTELL